MGVWKVMGDVGGRVWVYGRSCWVDVYGCMGDDVGGRVWVYGS